MKLILFIAALVWLVAACGEASITRNNSLPQNQSGPAEEPRFTAPPGEETSEITSLIDRLESDLASGKTTPSALLADSSYMQVHEWPRFRKLIREYAKTNQAVVVTPQEPGEPLVVSGSVSKKSGGSIDGAVVYVYQTSAKGWYSDKAPHISGSSGDDRHARLFAYLRTGPDGKFEFRTIRPAGYPRSNLPAHIHFEIEAPGNPPTRLITEIQFEGDPRLTPEMRAHSVRDGFLIVPVTRDANGVQRVTADFKL